MVNIRKASINDLMAIRKANLWSLPENYSIKYYYYHFTTYPNLSFVAEDDGKIVGYVMGKIEEEDNPVLRHGHITSVAVSTEYRRMGIGKRLMEFAHETMAKVYGVKKCALQVRVSNAAALHMYKVSLNYKVTSTDVGYYADGEDAYKMSAVISPK